MPNLFRNKYRIPSVRLEGFDYGSNAAYFVTICTKDKEHFFGEVVGLGQNPNTNSSQSIVAATSVADETPGMSSLRSADVQLSDIGKIVEMEWLKTPGLRPDMNLELGVFVIMPNHFHAIIIIGNNQYNTNHHSERRRDDMPGVSSATMDSATNNFATMDSAYKFTANNSAKKRLQKQFYSTIQKPRIHYSRIQIICNCASKKFRLSPFGLANPFPRSYYPRRQIIPSNRRLHSQQSIYLAKRCILFIIHPQPAFNANHNHFLAKPYMRL